MNDLVSLMKRIDKNELNEFMNKTITIHLNYRWEFKGKKMRSYIEMHLNSRTYQTKDNAIILKNKDMISSLLKDEAKKINLYLTHNKIDINRKSFRFFYLKGEKQGKNLGSFL